jgi:hypothetical protein
MSETPREDAEPATEPEAAIEGVAVELPGDPAPAPPAPAAPAPVAPAPVAAPAAPAAPPPPPPMTATAEAVGSAFDGHAPEPPMNPLGDIAAERPEILVGAAFAGGILAAMILRRLGS